MAMVGLEQLLLPFWNVVVAGKAYVCCVPLPPGSVNWFDPPWAVVCGGVVYEVTRVADPWPFTQIPPVPTAPEPVEIAGTSIAPVAMLNRYR
jgi:hypothetical protein